MPQLIIPEQYANNVFSRLASAISSGDLTLTVQSATGFPTTGNFRLVIDVEILIVTAVSGTTFTVLRGQEGTTAASHTQDTIVEHDLTRDSLLGLGSRIHHSDSVFGQPSSSIPGRLFIPHNGHLWEFDTSSGWLQFGPIYPSGKPPALTSWTFTNAGSAVATQSGDAINLFQAALAGNNRRILEIATPATPYTITALVECEVYYSTFPSAGLVWRESSSDKQHLFHFTGTSATDITLRTAYSAGVSTFHNTMVARSGIPLRRIWLQQSDDGTNRTWRYSWDGLVYHQLDQRVRTYYDGATNMTPDRIGFFCESISATYPAGITLLSWKQE